MTRHFPLASILIAPLPRAFDNTPFEVIAHEVPEGLIVNAPNNVNLILSNELKKAIPAFGTLRTTLQNSTVPKITANYAEFNPTIVANRNKDAIKASGLPTVWQASQDATIKESENWDRNEAKYKAIPAVIDASVEQAWRDHIRGMPSVADRLRAMDELPIEAVFAVHRLGPAAFNLTEDQLRPSVDRIIAYNLSKADSLRTSFTREPSLADPIARGVDEEKIAAYVAGAIETFQKRRELIQDARNELFGVIEFVAVVTELKPEQAFNLLSGVEEKKDA